MSGDEAGERFRRNPFFVLALPPTASRAEVEREGQKLIGMLALGLAAARAYRTPVGPAERDESLVRAAMAELRDPEKRLDHELWARLANDEAAVAPAPASPSAEPAPWREGPVVLGWRAR